MRLCLYLGTRGCPRVLEDALRDSFAPLHILIPIEPNLLGPNTNHDALASGLATLADLLAHRATEHAHRAATRETQPLTDVFNQDPEDAQAPIESHILEPPWLDALGHHADPATVDACYIARDALEILNDAGQRPGDTLDAHDVPLITR